MLSTTPIVDPQPLINQVLATLPGVIPDIVRMELFDAVRDFCRLSLALRAEAHEVLAAGTSDMVVPDDGEGLEVIKVLSISTTLGTPIHPTANRPLVVVDGQPTRFNCPSEKWVVFNGRPAEDFPFVAVCALAPVTSNVLVPEILWNKYYEAIKAGTLGRLYDQPSKPYSNVNKAALNLRRAYALARNAEIDAIRAGTSTDQIWRYPTMGT